MFLDSQTDQSVINLTNGFDYISPLNQCMSSKKNCTCPACAAKPHYEFLHGFTRYLWIWSSANKHQAFTSSEWKLKALQIDEMDNNTII